MSLATLTINIEYFEWNRAKKMLSISTEDLIQYSTMTVYDDKILYSTILEIVGVRSTYWFNISGILGESNIYHLSDSNGNLLLPGVGAVPKDIEGIRVRVS